MKIGHHHRFFKNKQNELFLFIFKEKIQGKLEKFRKSRKGFRGPVRAESVVE